MAKRPVAVSGATSTSGDRWVQLSREDQTFWVRHTDFVDEPKAKRALAQRGLVLVAKSWKLVAEHVGTLSLEDFPRCVLIEAPGWTEGYFTLPDGTVFAPPGAEPPPVVFEPDSTKCLVGGSLEDWLTEVAEPLANHVLPSFVFMLAFAAPLLVLTGRLDNFAFELVGGPGSGKSTLQYLMASAFGRITNDGQGKYWDTADATLEGLLKRLPMHAGLCMVVDELNAFYPESTAAARGKYLKGLSFRFAAGTLKETHDRKGRPVYRLIALFSSNEPLLATLAEPNRAVSQAATSRLMTLRIPADQRNGVFDGGLPHNQDARTFAQSVEAAARRNYGHASESTSAGSLEIGRAMKPHYRPKLRMTWSSSSSAPASSDKMARSAASQKRSLLFTRRVVWPSATGSCLSPSDAVPRPCVAIGSFWSAQSQSGASMSVSPSTFANLAYWTWMKWGCRRCLSARSVRRSRFEKGTDAGRPKS